LKKTLPLSITSTESSAESAVGGIDTSQVITGAEEPPGHL